MGGQLPQIYFFFIFFMAFRFLCWLVIIIPWGLCLSFLLLWAHAKDDLFTRLIFSLAHFHALSYFLGVFSLCVFPSLANNTHILGLTHVVSLAFDHFDFLLASMGLSIQHHRCSTWIPSNLPPKFVPLTKFCCPPHGIKILGVPFGFTSFVFFP